MEPEDNGIISLKWWEGKICQSVFLYPAKMCFNNEWERTFLDKPNMREFTVSK